MHSKQQQIEILFHMLKKNSIYKNWTCEMRKLHFIFFVPPNEELEGTAPPKIWMYPQMKKFVGML